MARDYRVHDPKAAQPKRGMCDGLKLTGSSDKGLANDAPGRPRQVKLAEVRVSARSLDHAAARSPLETAVERFARVTKEIVDVRRAGDRKSTRLNSSH